MREVLASVEATLVARCQIVEAWAKDEKFRRFRDPRSLRLSRGLIGFRTSPPKVTVRDSWTFALCARALARRVWGRAFLHPARIDHDALIKARAEFQAHPKRLASVGLEITQRDVFYIEPWGAQSAIVPARQEAR